MRYFDTSFLVPLILPEATSEPITEFLEGVSAEELTVSHWTRVEFASLLAREVRMGNLDAAAARKAGAKFDLITYEAHVRTCAWPETRSRRRPWRLATLSASVGPPSRAPGDVKRWDDRAG